MSIALTVAWLCVAIWAYLLLARGYFWKIDKNKPAPFPAHWPDVAVIIPARNEADIVPLTLPSLLANDYPGILRVILVDDRSEDGTALAAARIAEALGADDRLKVVSAPPTPAGWKGKVWAMQCGLEQVAGMKDAPHYVLFTDADIAYDKTALTQLVAQAEAEDCVLASRMVRLRCESAAERLLIPAFVYFFKMLYPFRQVNRPERLVAAAAGGCMLARYDAVQKAGGMEPIRHALIDDCAFGRMLKKQGRISLALASDIHSLRPYPHFADIRTMVARSAYDQLDYSPLKLCIAVAGLLMSFIAPVTLALFATGDAQLLGAVSWGCMAFSFLPMLRFYRRSLLWSFALPMIAACYMGFTLDSAWQCARGRGGAWKGRIQANRAQPA